MRISRFAAAVFAVAVIIGATTFSSNHASAEPAAPMSAVELRAQVEALKARVEALEALVAALQSDIVPRLGDFVEVTDVPTDLNGDGDTDDLGVDLDGDGFGDADELLPTVRIVGANLQIVNGHDSEQTSSLNGLGNLIVGYNEPRSSEYPFVCSDGNFGNEVDCTDNLYHWAPSHKSGSHNLVGGGGIVGLVSHGNSYSSFGGLVFGIDSVINAPWATVSGGSGGTASGMVSSVSGGLENRASAVGSSVSGGQLNRASGMVSSVSGGLDNRASAVGSSVSGGEDNTASGAHSSVSGGWFNTALSSADSVSGGSENVASGGMSSVSGGTGRAAPGAYDWAAGNLFEDF